MERSDIDRLEVFGETQNATERIAPGYFRKRLEEEHIARYTWASHWVNGKSVLDIACGTGYGSKLLLNAGAKRVVSADVALSALRFGSQEYPGPDYVMVDALHLPFRGSSYEVVVSLETIEHLPEPRRFLRSLRELMNEQGVLLLSTPDCSRTTGHNHYHLHEFGFQELIESLNEAGLGILGIWGQHWAPTSTLLRKKIWGIRRVTRDLERLPWVLKLPRNLAFTPAVWCILCKISI